MKDGRGGTRRSEPAPCDRGRTHVPGCRTLRFPRRRRGSGRIGRTAPHGALLKRIQAGHVRVGIIGLGYVGLPLARAFCDRGIAVLGFDVDPAKVERLGRGESYIGHIPSETIRSMRQGRFEATGRLPPAGRARRDHHLRAHAADRVARTGPDATSSTPPGPSPSGCGPASSWSWRAPPTRARPARSSCRSWPTSGLRAGRDFFLAFSPEREDPGNPQFSAPTIPKVVGGPRPGQPRAGRGALRQGGRPGRAGLQPRGRRGLQDPREHLPRRQHRPGQRAEDALRPDGHRRLGGDRGGQDQAVRLPGVLPGPRPGRALHPHRPVLSDLGGPQARADHAVHRAGRRDQHLDARLCRQHGSPTP